jgi:hypothetical protein
VRFCAGARALSLTGAGGPDSVPSVAGYVELPEGWERVSAQGPGPFVTSEVLRRPDGTEVRWQSRAHRKGRQGGSTRQPAEAVWWRPGSHDWWMAVLFMLGTVFFNVSTFTALHHNLTTHQINARVWAPDAFGSVAFLISSELAFAEVGHRWLSFRHRTLSWWIVALNLLGSIAFGASAVASLIEPSSGQEISARLANAGTSFGGLCFFVTALMLLPEAARQRAAREQCAVG